MAKTKIHLSAEASDEFHRFSDLTAAVANHQAAMAERLGLNLTEFKCLAQIHRYNALVPRELSEWMHLSRPAVSVILDRLVKKGLISRQINAEDRRSLRLVATEKALSLLDRLYAPTAVAVTRLHRRYSVEQCRTVKDYLLNSIEMLNRGAEKVRSQGSPRVRVEFDPLAR